MKATLTADELKILGFKPTIFIVEGYYHEKTDILIQIGANGQNKQMTDCLQRITSTKITTLEEAKEAIQELEGRLLEPERPNMEEAYANHKRKQTMEKKFRRKLPDLSKRPKPQQKQ